MVPAVIRDRACVELDSLTAKDVAVIAFQAYHDHRIKNFSRQNFVFGEFSLVDGLRHPDQGKLVIVTHDPVSKGLYSLSDTLSRNRPRILRFQTIYYFNYRLSNLIVS